MNGGQLYCHLHYDPSSFYSTAPSSYGGGGPGSVIDDMDDDMLEDGLCRYVQFLAHVAEHFIPVKNSH